jgi:hypothetical protein
MLRKNVAGQFLHVAAVNATTGAALTGATISIRRCLDGTFAAGGATITEDTGLGFYKVALTQADTNGNDIGYFFTATNMIPICLNVVTTAADPTDGVRLGLTALPNAAAGAAGGLVVIGTGANNFKSDASANVTFANTSITTVTTVTNQLTAAQIATGVWQDTTAGDFTTVGSIGKSLFTSGNAPGAASGLALVGSNMGTASSVTGSVASIAAGGITAASFAANAIDRDGVWAKTQVELASDPGATPTVLQAQMLYFMSIRNKRETDSGGGTDKIYNSAGSVILTAAVSDSGTVFTKAKYA